MAVAERSPRPRPPVRRRHSIAVFVCAALLAQLLPLATAGGTGTGTVMGFVYDETTMTPVPNVAVTSGAHNAVTDFFGFYRLDGMSPGQHDVTVLLQSEQVMVSDGGWTRQDFPLDPVELPPRTFPLVGTVSDINTGQPLPGVEVTAGGDTAISDEDGFYRIEDLSPGVTTVTMEKDGYLQGTGTVNIADEGAVATGFLKTEHSTDLAGTVRGPRLDEVGPVEGALVAMTGYLSPDAHDDDPFVGPELVHTGPDGGFIFRDLPPGHYRIEVATNSYDPHSEEVAYDPADGPLEDLDILLEPRWASLEVLVSSSAYGGEPLEGITVRVEGESTSDVADIADETITDETGTASWPELLPGPYTLTVEFATDGEDEPWLEPYTEELTLETDGDVTRELDLQPNYGTPEVRIDTLDPEGIGIRAHPARKVYSNDFFARLIDHVVVELCAAGSPDVTLYPYHHHYDAVCVDPELPQPDVPPPATGPEPGVASGGLFPMAHPRQRLPDNVLVEIVGAEHPHGGTVDRSAIHILKSSAGVGPVGESNRVDISLALADGAFGGQLPPADYELELRSSEMDPIRVEFTVEPAAAEPVDVLAVPAWGHVAGHLVHVLWPNRPDWENQVNRYPAALRGAELTLSDGTNTFHATTDLRGFYQLSKVPPGDYALNVSHQLAQGNFGVTVLGDGAVNVVTRVVPSLIGQEVTLDIRHRWFDSEGIMHEDPAWGDAVLMHTGSGQSLGHFVNGAVSLPVPAGVYDIPFYAMMCGLRHAAAGGSTTITHITTTLPDGSIECSTPPPSHLRHAGVVVNERGEPIANATVRVTNTYMNPYTGEEVEPIPIDVETSADGAYVVNVPFGLEFFVMKPNTSVIRATATRYQPFETTIPREHFLAHREYSADIVMEAATTLEGTVQDLSTGGPLTDAEVLVDGVAAHDGAGGYSAVVEPGTTVTLVARRDGYYTEKTTVTIAEAQRGQAVVGPTLQLEPIPPAEVQNPGAGEPLPFLVSDADDKPLRGVVLVGFDQYEGMDSLTPSSGVNFTQVAWQIRVDREAANLREGFRDPVVSVQLGAEGVTCGNESDLDDEAAKLVKEFRGVPRDVDDDGTGTWGLGFDVARHLPCGPLQWTITAVTQAGVETEHELPAGITGEGWYLQPTAGDRPLRDLVWLYTRTPPWLLPGASVKIPQLSLEITPGGLKAERTDDGRHLQYELGPIEIGTESEDKNLAFLAMAGLEKPSLKLGMEAVKASGQTGQYNFQFKITAGAAVQKELWKSNYETKAKRRVPRSGRFQVGPPEFSYSETWGVTKMAMAENLPFTWSCTTNECKLGREWDFGLAVGITYVIPFTWVPKVGPILEAFFEAKRMFLKIDRPSIEVKPGVGAKEDFGVNPFFWWDIPFVSPGNTLRDVVDTPRTWNRSASLGITAKYGDIGANKKISVLGLEAGVKAAGNTVFLTGPGGGLQTIDVKGEAFAKAKVGWFGKEIKTDDVQLVNWKRGTESEVYGSGGTVDFGFASIAEVGEAAGDNGLYVFGGGSQGLVMGGMVDAGNTAMARDGQGQVVALRTMGGQDVAAFPGDHQLYYLVHDEATGEWTPPQLLGPPSPGMTRDVTAARLPDGRVLAVWSAMTTAVEQPFDALLHYRDHQLFYALWDGTSWSVPVQLTATDHADERPALAVQPGGEVRLVWVADRDSYALTADDTELRSATWNGDGFDAPETLLVGVGAVSQLSVSQSDTTVVTFLQEGAEPSDPLRPASVALDSGAWLPAHLPTGGNDTLFVVTTPVDGGGRVFWAQREDDHDAVYTATVQGGDWSAPTLLAQEPLVQSLAAVPAGGGVTGVAWLAPGESSVLRTWIRQADGTVTQETLTGLADGATGLTALPGSEDVLFTYQAPGDFGLLEWHVAGVAADLPDDDPPDDDTPDDDTPDDDTPDDDTPDDSTPGTGVPGGSPSPSPSPLPESGRQHVTEEAEAGETVSTDPQGSGVTADQPAHVAVTTPVAGTVEIVVEPLPTDAAQDGFTLLGMQVVLSAPRATAEEPLAIEVSLHDTMLPAGATADDIVVFRDGIAVPDCTGPPGEAQPDPCVTGRANVDDGVALTILTSQASVWTFGVAVPADPPAPGVCPADVPASGFADVSADNVHRTAIDCAAWRGIARGLDATTFGPDRSVSRAQMASFMLRTIQSAGVAVPAGEDRFADVDGDVHAAAIHALAEAGVVRGTSATTYDPHGAVTREQMASFLVRAHEYVTGAAPTAPPGDRFDDIATSAHRDAINAAAAAGLTTGRTETTFAPREEVRRDQMASFLVRLLDAMVR